MKLCYSPPTIYVNTSEQGNLCGVNTYNYYNLSVFGLKHEFWTIPTTNMTCTRSQNFTNMTIDEHGIQFYKVVVVVLFLLMLLFDVFVSTSLGGASLNKNQ